MRYLAGLAAVLLLCTAARAQAQTVLAPSGDSAVTQPGGTQGHAARRNIREAVRNGDVVGRRPMPAGHGANRDADRGGFPTLGDAGRR